MNPSRRSLAAALLLAGAGAAVHAQTADAPASYGGWSDVALETAADHFSTQRAGAGGLFGYRSPWQYFGVAAQDSFYEQSGWHRDAPALFGIWRDQSRDTLAGVNAQAGIVQVAGRTRPIGDIDWALRPAPDTGVELLAAGGLVETQAALDQGIGYTFWGASLEQRFAGHFTIIGLAAVQPISDGNDRSHFRARLVWDALPDEGINLQLRWRQFHDSRVDVGPYFDPESYQQWLAVVGLRKRAAGWTTTGSLGAGQETIHDGGTTRQPAYLAELGVEGPVAGNARLVVQAQYTRSQAYANTPDYWWGSLHATLIVPF
jgi:hypothetical protein